MKKLVIICLCVISTFSLSAHDPLSAKFELKETKQGALLNIYLTQTGVHKALLTSYPEVDFESIETNAYKELLVQYLKEKIKIEADGQLLKIGAGAIKLGSHQTNLKFQIDNYPPEVTAVKLNIDAFAENGRQQSVFWWHTSAIAERVILSVRNDYQVEIDTLAEQESEDFMAGFGNLIWLVLALLAFAIIGTMVKKHRQKIAT